MRCPCRKVSETIDYSACCGPIHAGTIVAQSALALMRARYAAYALGNAGFIAMTWHPSTRPQPIDLPPGERWISLKIIGTSEQGDEATVTFVARARDGGRTSLLEETSRFRRIEGRWLYVDGNIAASASDTERTAGSRRALRS